MPVEQEFLVWFTVSLPEITQKTKNNHPLLISPDIERMSRITEGKKNDNLGERREETPPTRSRSFPVM